VGEDGVIRARWFWNGWKDWFELGDARFSRTAGIAALSREPRHMEIFAVGVDGAIRKNVFWDGWKGWEVLSCEDSVAWTDSTHPEPGVRLHFVNNAGVYRSPRVIGANGAQLRTGCLEVPIAGFSAGGQMFVFYSTDAFVENDHGLMGRTVLCRAEGGDPTNLHVLYDVSDIRRHPRGHFINVACVVVPEGLDGLPFRGPALLAWGSGRYRQSDVYLAAVPLERLGSRSAWRFFTGLGPIPWSHHEQQATKLFSHPEVGELSVGWIQPFNAWLMLYNAGNPRGIVGRVAPAPWGPWSDPPVRVFDPDAPGVGYGEFMHRAGSGDGLSDPGREREWGGEYGPYLIDRYTKALPADEAGPRVQAYFVMSTWNPYNTVLMTATLGVSE
jgi:Domain of unknown function (DUF4185)